MGVVHSNILKTYLLSLYIMIMGNITRYFSLLSHQRTQLFYDTYTWVLIYYYAGARVLVYDLNKKYMFFVYVAMVLFLNSLKVLPLGGIYPR